MGPLFPDGEGIQEVAQEILRGVGKAIHSSFLHIRAERAADAKHDVESDGNVALQLLGEQA